MLKAPYPSCHAKLRCSGNVSWTHLDDPPLMSNPFPAINRRAILRRPYGTDTSYGNTSLPGDKSPGYSRDVPAGWRMRRYMLYSFSACTMLVNIALASPKSISVLSA